MYKTEEERLAALRASRNKYQKTRTWYCDICNNGQNYLMTNKSKHEQTKKHQLNAQLTEALNRDLIKL